jgi:transposase
MRGRPRTLIQLSQEEHDQLQRWVRQRTTAQILALRARIILESASGYTNASIAERLSIAPQTVTKWRKRFIKQRLDGLTDAPRTGAPRKIGEQLVEHLVIRTMTEPPANATHWTTRMLASELGISQSTVSRIWRGHGLHPWRQESFQLSSDPQFREQIIDIIGLHLDPPVKAFALCLHPRHATPRTRPLANPAHLQGRELTMPADLERGERQIIQFGRMAGMQGTPQHSGTRPLLAFLRLVADRTPRDLEIHVVLDDTMQRPGILSWLIRRPRVRVRFTPHPVAWLHELRLCYLGLGQRQTTQGLSLSSSAMLQALGDAMRSAAASPVRLTWVQQAIDIELCKAQFNL